MTRRARGAILPLTFALLLGAALGFFVPRLGCCVPPPQFVRPMFAADKNGFAANPPWEVDAGAMTGVGTASPSPSYLPTDLWPGPLTLEPYKGNINGISLDGYALRASDTVKTIVLFAAGNGVVSDVTNSCPAQGQIVIYQFVRPMIAFYNNNWQIDKLAATTASLTLPLKPFSGSTNDDQFDGFGLVQKSALVLYIHSYKGLAPNIADDITSKVCPKSATSHSSVGAGPTH